VYKFIKSRTQNLNARTLYMIASNSADYNRTMLNLRK